MVSRQLFLHLHVAHNLFFWHSCHQSFLNQSLEHLPSSLSHHPNFHHFLNHSITSVCVSDSLHTLAFQFLDLFVFNDLLNFISANYSHGHRLWPGSMIAQKFFTYEIMNGKNPLLSSLTSATSPFSVLIQLLQISCFFSESPIRWYLLSLRIL